MTRLRAALWPAVRMLLVWMACCGLLLWRAHLRHQDLHVWAEDGAIYLSHAMNIGWRSLKVPYSGYYQGLPQGLMLLLMRHGLTHLPMSIFYISVGIYGAGAALFARRCYRWLVASDALRVATALALCLTPGLWETLGSLANVQWVLLLWGGLIACKDLDEDLSVVDVIVLFLIGSGAGAACTLLLPLGVRAYVRLRRGSQARALQTRPPQTRQWGTWACLAVLLLWTGANIALNMDSGGGPHASISQIPHFGLFTVLSRYILQPVIGEVLVAKYASQLTWLMLAGVALSLLTIKPLVRIWRANPVFMAWVCSNICIYMLAFWSRPHFGRQLFAVGGQDRFAVPAGQCALLLWVACLAGYATRPLAGVDASNGLGKLDGLGKLGEGDAGSRSFTFATLLSFMFLGVYAAVGHARFAIVPYPGVQSSWAETARVLEASVGSKTAITVMCRPNFQITYDPQEALHQ